MLRIQKRNRKEEEKKKDEGKLVFAFFSQCTHCIMLFKTFPYNSLVGRNEIKPDLVDILKLMTCLVPCYHG
jgi:hypothetical protein